MNAKNRLTDVLKTVETLLDHTLVSATVAIVFKAMGFLAMVNLKYSQCSTDSPQFFESDVDECAENTDGCEQICTNTIGSFICDCRTGYTLNSDGRNCQGKIFKYITVFFNQQFLIIYRY